MEEEGGVLSSLNKTNDLATWRLAEQKDIRIVLSAVLSRPITQFYNELNV